MDKRKDYGILIKRINSASNSELIGIKADAETLYKQGCLKIDEVNHIIELTEIGG